MIAMLDGVKLFTIVYSPKDRSQPYSILPQRTPSSVAHYAPDEFKTAEQLAPGVDFVRAGHISVFQDARVTYRSEGEWVNLRPLRAHPESIDETTGSYDTIDRLVKNVPDNNGRDGPWGISHPGWYMVMVKIPPHPH